MRRAAAVAAFVALSWLFGGRWGLVAAALIAALWLYLRPSRWVLWAGSLVLLAAAPIALIAQGLPRAGTLGGSFGAHHMAAHVLVGLSLALAGFAGLTELADEVPARGPRRRSPGPRPTRLGERRRGLAGRPSVRRGARRR